MNLSSIGNHTIFLVQFGINFLEGVFHEQVLEDLIFCQFFSLKKAFPKFPQKFCHHFASYQWLRKVAIVIINIFDMLFALGSNFLAVVLHLNYTALSQSESCFFHVYY